MSGYVPTLDEVREAVEEWMWSRRMWRKELEQADGMEFDRWLAEVVRAAAEKAYEQGRLDERHDCNLTASFERGEMTMEELQANLRNRNPR